MDINRIIQVPLAQLAPHPMNRGLYGDIHVEPEMIESVRDRGILQPLLLADINLFPDVPRGQHRYVIVAGHRRRLAAELANLDSVPAVIRSYASEAETQIDLVASNRQRVKSTAMINAEISLLHQQLSAFMTDRQRSGIANTQPVEAPGLGTIEPGARSRDVIAEHMDMSPEEVKRRTVVADPVHKDKFCDTLRRLGASESQVAAMLDEWFAICDEYEDDETTLNDAYHRVLELKREYSSFVEDQHPKATSEPEPANIDDEPEPEAADEPVHSLDTIFAEWITACKASKRSGLSPEGRDVRTRWPVGDYAIDIAVAHDTDVTAVRTLPNSDDQEPSPWYVIATNDQSRAAAYVVLIQILFRRLLQ